MFEKINIYLIIIFTSIFRYSKNLVIYILNRPLNFIKKIFYFLAIILLFIVLITFLISFGYFNNKPISFHLKLTEFYLLNNFLNLIDKTSLNEISITNKLREKNFYQYKNISKQFNHNDYSSIAFFYFIDNEYNNLTSQKVYKNDKYNTLYFKELTDILNNYEYFNNIDEPGFIYTSCSKGSAPSSCYKYKHRTNFYLYLIKSYKNFIKKNNMNNDLILDKFYKKFLYIKTQDLNNSKLMYLNSNKYIRKNYQFLYEELYK